MTWPVCHSVEALIGVVLPWVAPGTVTAQTPPAACGVPRTCSLRRVTGGLIRSPYFVVQCLPAPNHICALPRVFLTLPRLDRLPACGRLAARLQLLWQYRPMHTPPQPNQIPACCLSIRIRVCTSASGPFLTASRRIRSPNSGPDSSRARLSGEHPEYPRILASLQCKGWSGRTTPPLNELGLRIAPEFTEKLLAESCRL